MEDEDSGPRFRRQGRLGRLVKLGGLAANVASTTVARRIGSILKNDEERAEALKDSLIDSAQKVVRTMGEMKGAAMKVGQMLSVAPEALPREFLEQLKALQKDSPSMDYALVAAEFQRATGRTIPEAFRTFEPTPIGAASIGQVHRARLFDGRDVVVKVQYPGIADTLDADIRNLGAALQMARVLTDKQHVDGLMEEVRTGILEEANYVLEAKNLEKYGAILREHPRIVVPDVIPEFSSEHVLTMSYVAGEKLDLGLEAIQDTAARHKLAFDFSETIIWMFHRRFVLHADPHPGNFLLTPDGRFGFLDFGCFRSYEPDFCDAWLDLLVAKWTGKRHQLRAIHERIGFRAVGSSEGPTDEQLDRLLDVVLQPFLEDREFDWGEWQPHKLVQDFLRSNLNIVRFPAPPKAVFYLRVCAGIWGFLQRQRARGNWYRLARQTAIDRGRLPLPA
ncbi:MAG: AarF/ABC1/UbiB kinase family protein [Myxococcota bacterium]